VGENCLSREVVKSIARGRSPKKELTAARRHLADCPRCRAAVVAAAHGVEGPGDTVLLKRSSGAVPKGFKVAAVAASILATGAAWRYTATPKAEPPRDVRSLALEPSAAAAAELPTRDASPATTWQRSVTVQQVEAQQLEAPGTLPAPAVERLDAPATAPTVPTVRVINAVPNEPAPASAEEPWHSPRSTVAPPTKRQPRPAPRAARPAPSPASPPPAAAAGEKKADDYDFGIDELPPAAGRKNMVRTTLD
jgi:hypothetical protein